MLSNFFLWAIENKTMSVTQAENPPMAQATSELSGGMKVEVVKKPRSEAQKASLKIARQKALTMRQKKAASVRQEKEAARVEHREKKAATKRGGDPTTKTTSDESQSHESSDERKQSEETDINTLDQSESGDSESEVEYVKPARTKPRKKRIVVVEESSDSEVEVRIPKRRQRISPPDVHQTENDLVFKAAMNKMFSL